MSDPLFFPTPEPLDAQQLAAITGAAIARSGRRDVRITGVASASRAGPGDLVVASEDAGEAVRTSRAGAFVVSPGLASLAPERAVVLVTADPLAALARATAALYPLAARPQAAFGPGVSEAAIVHPRARLEPDVTIDPGVVIGPGAEIGRGTVICANAVIGPDVRIGRASAIGFGASISHALIGDRVIVRQGARLGQAGPAMETSAGSRPGHVGRVIIQDDVDIGANATIDRGSDQDTVIGERSRIDNLVNIGHNVVVGRGCVIFAHASIAAGTALGDFTVVDERVERTGRGVTGAGARLHDGASGDRRDLPDNRDN